MRTVREALAVARDDLRAALGLLDARVVAGDARSARARRGRALELAERACAGALPELDAAVEATGTPPGEVAFLLEPDLKEDRGGLRDIHAVRSRRPAAARPSPPRSPRPLGAPRALGRVRAGLHVEPEAPGDRLLLQDQDQVAARLGSRRRRRADVGGGAAAREVGVDLRRHLASCPLVARGPRGADRGP